LEHAKVLSDRINKALKTKEVPNSGDGNLIGSLGEVRIGTEAGLLIITTAVGIVCQYDESAYVYQFMEGRWRLIWESEQTNYSPKQYLPQHISAVHVWRSFKDARLDVASGLLPRLAS
jgi:hypothetical protein